MKINKFRYKWNNKYNEKKIELKEILGKNLQNPNFNIEKKLEELDKNNNIEIIGEMVFKSHGWINSALTTVK